MKFWVALLCFALLSACASRPVEQRPDYLFQDALFQPPAERVGADGIFTVSGAMQRYLSSEIGRQFRTKAPQQALIDALYRKNQLRLEYDSVMTRNASEAFEARAGNCLSLVIMTAAFAKELGLSVQYNSVHTDEMWTRSEDIYFDNRHINLTLGSRPRDYRVTTDTANELTIDFIPQEFLLRQWSRAIGEETIVAMYMNNKAAEALARARLDDAYWWAREAIRQDAKFLSSYITLGVIYRRHGQSPMAEQVLRHVLEREPENVNALSNMVVVLSDGGRRDEAAALARKLARIEPNPPFRLFEQGAAALKGKDFAAARDLFSKALERGAYYHEFHFGLAVAYLGLGDFSKARDELTVAMENSTTRKEHDLYAAKLGLIDAMRRKPRPANE